MASDSFNDNNITCTPPASRSLLELSPPSAMSIDAPAATTTESELESLSPDDMSVEPAAAATKSVLELLPPDAMSFFLEHLILPQWVVLASCSHTLKVQIYQEQQYLWRSINFETIPDKYTSKVTDTSLSSLLSRTNACDVTKVLSLRNCKLIRGSGLAPLSFSHVLEKIDLRIGPNDNSTLGPTNLDLCVVLPTLRSMMQYNLFLVKFRKRRRDVLISDCFDGRICSFNRDLLTCRLKDAQEQSITCHQCDKFVMEGVPIEWASTNRRCGGCDHYFCRTAECNCIVRDCHQCLASYCKICDDMPVCKRCSNSHCGTCLVTTNCTRCGDSYCQRCEENAAIPLMPCDECHKLECSGCQQNSMSICVGCSCFYHTECRSVHRCNVCQSMRCIECDITKNCESCGNSCCSDCRFSCGDCDKVECDTCETNPMMICAGRCNGIYHTECRSFHECCDMSDPVCVKCETIKNCATCGKDRCSECWNECKGCNEIYCDEDDCQPSCCSKCDEAYCKKCWETQDKCTVCYDSSASICGKCVGAKSCGVCES